MKVYAKAGDTVADVMYDHGALMLVSLDGLYAVKVDNTGKLRVGESVSVVGADGTQADGQIAAIEKETATVTVPLSGFSFDEKVTVNASSGTTLGSGKLFVYSQQKITGYSGTVASVSVGEGTAVSSGDTLLTLSDTDYTADTSVLLKQRKKLVDQSNRLTQISKTGYVYADEDGVITNLNSDLLDTSASNVVVATKGAAANNDKTTAANDAGSSDGDKTSEGAEKKSQVTAQDNDKAKDETEKKSEKESETDRSNETITITAKVVWRASDGSDLTEGLPNSVTVSVSPGSKKQTASAGNDWSVSFDDLPKYNDDGSKEINYEVSVSGVPSGFDSSFSSSGNKATIYLTKTASESGEEESSSAASGSSDTTESDSSSSSSASSASGEDASTTSESGSSSAKSGSAASSSSAASSKGSGSKGAAGKTPGGGLSAGSMSSSGPSPKRAPRLQTPRRSRKTPMRTRKPSCVPLCPTMRFRSTYRSTSWTLAVSSSVQEPR